MLSGVAPSWSRRRRLRARFLRACRLEAGGGEFSVWGLGFGAWAPIGKSLTRIYPVQSERSGEYGTGALRAE